MLFFSPSTCGFYDPAINSSIPVDAVEITMAERSAALAALEPNTHIVGGPDGKPVIATIEVSPAELIARLRDERDRRLSASDHTQLPDYPLSDMARVAWAAYRQALRDLPETITDPASVEWPLPPTA